MSNPLLTKVRVKPGSTVSHAGKLYYAGGPNGDTVEVPTSVIPELRWQVEILDASGKASEVPAAAGVHIPVAGQPHEKLGFLQQRKEALTGEMARIDAQIAATEKEIETGRKSKKDGGSAISAEDEVQGAMNIEATEAQSGVPVRSTKSTSKGKG